MAPVARELSKHFGVIEPLQTADSLEGQIQELRLQINSAGTENLVLIGSSWGAVLILFLAARYPGLARKLVLVGSAVFDAESSRKVKAIRLARTPPLTLKKIEALQAQMTIASGNEKKELFARIADLEFDADVVDPVTRNLELVDIQPDLNRSVWGDFVRLRDEPGALRAAFSKIHCDTLIIHGEHDPHVIEGILPFLKSCIPNVRLEWLKQCGHYPWIERAARDRFFQILNRECE